MITIKAIGHDKRSATQQLCDEYIKRCRLSINLKTKEFKGDTRREQQWLESDLPDNSYIVALDSKGNLLDSLQFAHKIETALSHGKGIYCIIGGSEGLSASIKQQAHLLLSFGHITLPHLLARVVLCEQLYRAECINTSHPYHK